MLENLIPLSVASLTPSNLGSNSYILLLKSNENNKIVFPIVIGPSEAQTISVFLENIEIPRPLTAQLLLSVLNIHQTTFEKVTISGFKDGIFYSTIYLKNEKGCFTIDSRPSDSIALAIKANVPIYIEEKLLQSIQIYSDELDEPEIIEDLAINSAPITMEDLSNQLNKALDNEEYETAAKIRDQIEKFRNK